MCSRLDAASIAVPAGDRPDSSAFSVARLGEGPQLHFSRFVQAGKACHQQNLIHGQTSPHLPPHGVLNANHHHARLQLHPLPRRFLHLRLSGPAESATRALRMRLQLRLPALPLRLMPGRARGGLIHHRPPRAGTG
jgi:hypothetical protein